MGTKTSWSTPTAIHPSTRTPSSSIPSRSPSALLEPDQGGEHDVQRHQSRSLEQYRFAVARDLPDRYRRQGECAHVDGVDHERQLLGEEQRDEDESGEQEARDLGDRVLHDRDREVRLALSREL